MTLFPWIHNRILLPVALAFCLSGCYMNSGGKVDEQREPYFIKGKNRVSSMDYKGAVEAFEKAIEVNPQSASAHFELGILYETRLNDWAAAVYHLEKHLKLRPSSALADVVRQRIMACKMELAKGASFALMSDQVQKEMEQLVSENRALREQIDLMQAQLNEAKRALAMSGSMGGASRAPGPEPGPDLSAQVREAQMGTSRPHSVSTERFHEVRQGETLYSIGRKYGLSDKEVMAANPGVDPKRLQVGQKLRIPSGRE